MTVLSVIVKSDFILNISSSMYR